MGLLHEIITKNNLSAQNLQLKERFAEAAQLATCNFPTKGYYRASSKANFRFCFPRI
jgi:hypothetical protein